jgi:hypothetical protein
MGVLGSLVLALVLSMLDVLHHLLLCCFVALQLIGDKHPWHAALLFEALTKTPLYRLRVPLSLQQNF